MRARAYFRKNINLIPTNYIVPKYFVYEMHDTYKSENIVLRYSHQKKTITRIVIVL